MQIGGSSNDIRSHQHMQLTNPYETMFEWISVEKLMKIMTNDDNGIPRWLSQPNNLNLDSMVEDIKGLGPLRFMCEYNNHDEEFIQVVKHEFTSQRGDNYGETLMHKIFMKKLLNIWVIRIRLMWLTCSMLKVTS